LATADSNSSLKDGTTSSQGPPRAFGLAWFAKKVLHKHGDEAEAWAFTVRLDLAYYVAVPLLAFILACVVAMMAL
jgi:hypothetical protein